MNYIYLKSKESITDDIPFIIEILSKAINIVKFDEVDNSLIIIYDYIKDSISNIAHILISDLYKTFTLYNSINYSSVEEIEKSSSLITTLLNTNNINEIYIDNKILLEKLYKNPSLELKKLILNNYYSDLEMLNTIRIFLEENQNASNASKELYLHRNTLNQRLDKFYEKTGFNVKIFTEAFYIYNLIK